MNNRENPTEGIVDIDTFCLYIKSYVADLNENHPRRKDRRLTSVKNMFPDMDLHPMIRLNKIPWAEVPQSLQDILGKHYDAAQLDEEKTISVDFSSKSLSFQLKSPHVRGFSDTYGEDLAVGVKLFLTGDKKGKWRFLRMSYAIADKIARRAVENLAIAIEEWKSFLMENSTVVAFPSTLNELHDLARFLEKSKDRAEVLEA